MNVRKILLCSVPMLLMVLLVVYPSRSQPRQQRPGGSGRRSGNIRETVIERLKEKLDAKDDNWKVLEPKISRMLKLLEQTRAMDGVRMYRTLLGPPNQGSGGPGGGPRGTKPKPDATVVEKSRTSLSETLERKMASSIQIKQKLAAYRETRVKAAQQLAKAEQELRDVLTARQEAQLVVVGMLE